MGSDSDRPSLTGSQGLAPTAEPCPQLAHRSDYRLVRALLMLQRSGATGTLRIEADSVLTLVRWRDGHPVFVEGGLPADSLGRILVRRGRITEAMLAQVEEERMLSQGRARFGEVAVRLGYLSAQELMQGLREQVVTKLGRCLHWERTSHVFVAEQHDVPALVGPPLHVERVVLEGVLRHHPLERALTLLDGGLDAAPVLRTGLAVVGARFELERPTLERLEGALGAATLGAAVRNASHEGRDLVLTLAALALCDQLVLPEPEAPEKSGPFVIDDLPRAARSRASVRGLDTELPPGAPGELPGREKLLADTAYLQGKQLLRAGEYGAAADAFREASNLRPAALEYTLCAAWSAYLSAGRLGKWRDMLVDLCERTLEQDGQLAFAHHVRGQLAFEVRDYRTAHEALTRALELDPDDDDARRTLSRIAN
jgi:hypothetical protein